MSVLFPEHLTREVLDRYGFGQPGVRAQPLGNHGGFSGASLWCVETPFGGFCLRAWPPRFTSGEHLEYIHRLMIRARQEGLAFVPAPCTALMGSTGIHHGGRWWELADWLPGLADYYAHPGDNRLRAACRGLAQVHGVWSGVQTVCGVCPGVERRLQACQDWQRLVRDGWQPDFSDSGLLSQASYLMPGRGDAGSTMRAWRLLGLWMERVPVLLQPWSRWVWDLQPCLCDVWHDHLLFEGEVLTGLVDYGAVKLDHVSVDLARLLGSLVGDDPRGWTVGLEAYRQERPLTEDEERLARVLDRTGVIVGAANWLRWVYREGRTYENVPAVAARLAGLVKRIESWG